MHLGSGSGRLPLALVGEDVKVASVQALEGFKLEDGGDERVRKAIQQAASAPREGDDELVAFLQRGTLAALDSSRRVQESVKRYKTEVTYPETGLG